MKYTRCVGANRMHKAGEIVKYQGKTYKVISCFELPVRNLAGAHFYMTLLET
jgi:hypothetical protein